MHGAVDQYDGNHLAPLGTPRLVDRSQLDRPPTDTEVSADRIDNADRVVAQMTSGVDDNHNPLGVGTARHDQVVTAGDSRNRPRATLPTSECGS